MSDLDATTPRVFLARHGETEWTISGRYTGTTEVNFTEEGVKQVRGTAAALVGPRRLLDPSRVVRVWVSPRKRARQTFELLFDGGAAVNADMVTVTEDIREWDYGDYEGLKVGEIKQLRKERGLDTDKPWDLWRDGCEGGESAQQVTERLDRLVGQVREIQGPNVNGEKPADVVLVAHGLILRAFFNRWMKYPLDMPLPMMFSPGAIGILSYKNRNVDEPGFHVGMALPFLE